ncbi:DUF3613 domain-containing protein [Alkalilimnicola ehrlichii MLHE-1]|uniref:DUF3613 domain-containing protein n=1 Tax=Alkalilimnicola ehrlichii (strain ATCC BAA-1101 / DSM 17681 / MLHE-1) TaxID=187272 RepID=Q0A6N9_ALKEH|nr:DUF3613 domain-containing protein [Alkalilimnicola ehrlichii]ABI57498.1 hypothetical protein Mlg_2156 [Alkalilimnicola ehrlichii MLHE-1]
MMSQRVNEQPRWRWCWPAVLVLFLTGPVLADGAAEEAESAVRSSPERAGEQTRAWLALQRDGDQASTYVQGLPEAARTRALRRYLDSFTHPIPETYFDRDSFGVD